MRRASSRPWSSPTASAMPAGTCCAGPGGAGSTGAATCASGRRASASNRRCRPPPPPPGAAASSTRGPRSAWRSRSPRSATRRRPSPPGGWPRSSGGASGATHELIGRFVELGLVGRQTHLALLPDLFWEASARWPDGGWVGLPVDLADVAERIGGGELVRVDERAATLGGARIAAVGDLPGALLRPLRLRPAAGPGAGGAADPTIPSSPVRCWVRAVARHLAAPERGPPARRRPPVVDRAPAALRAPAGGRPVAGPRDRGGVGHRARAPTDAGHPVRPPRRHDPPRGRAAGVAAAAAAPDRRARGHVPRGLAPPGHHRPRCGDPQPRRPPPGPRCASRSPPRAAASTGSPATSTST